MLIADIKDIYFLLKHLTPSPSPKGEGKEPSSLSLRIILELHFVHGSEISVSFIDKDFLDFLTPLL
jgi:hypothetical protein